MSSYTLKLYEVYTHAIDYSMVWSNTFTTLPKTELAIVTLNYHDFIGKEFDITLKRDAIASIQTWRTCNYCSLLVESSYLEYYFVDVAKTRISEGGVTIHLVYDEWMNNNCNSGIRILQSAGHDSAYSDYYAGHEYIVKPTYQGYKPSGVSINPANPFIKYNDSSFILGSLYTGLCFFYKIGTSVVGVVKLVAITDLSNIWGHVIKGAGASEISIDDGATWSNCEPIKMYVIPPAMLSLAFINRHLGSANLDVDIKVGATSYTDFASELIIGEMWEREIYIDRNILENYEDTWTNITTNRYPYKIEFGFLGQTFEMLPHIIKTGSTSNDIIYVRCIVGTNDLQTGINNGATGFKWVDTTNSFEEIITYSEYNQWIAQNRNSIANQRLFNVVGLVGGVAGAFTGQTQGLVSAIGNISATESAILDKQNKVGVTTGSQGGLANLFVCYGGGYGLGGMYFTITKCRNTVPCFGSTLRSGYKMDANSNETSQRIPKKIYDLIVSLGSDIAILHKAPYNNVTPNVSCRYIEGKGLYLMQPSQHQKNIPQVIVERLQKGMYVYNTPPAV